MVLFAVLLYKGGVEVQSDRLVMDCITSLLTSQSCFQWVVFANLKFFGDLSSLKQLPTPKGCAYSLLKEKYLSWTLMRCLQTKYIPANCGQVS